MTLRDRIDKSVLAILLLLFLALAAVLNMLDIKFHIFTFNKPRDIPQAAPLQSAEEALYSWKVVSETPYGTDIKVIVLEDAFGNRAHLFSTLSGSVLLRQSDRDPGMVWKLARVVQHDSIVFWYFQAYNQKIVLVSASHGLMWMSND